MNFDQQQLITLIVQIVLIAGALNWGSVALNYPDLVTLLVGDQIGNYIKLVVAAAGIYAAYQLFVSYQAKSAESAQAAEAQQESQ